MIPLKTKCISNRPIVNRTINRYLSSTLLTVLVGGASLFGTEALAQKKPLDHDVYDDWQSYGKREISPNGKWTAFNVNPQEGDKWLYVQSTTKEIPLQKIHRGENPNITTNSEHLIFSIKPFYKDIKAERVSKKKKSKDKIELAKDSLGIYNFSKNELIKIPEMISFKLPKENGDFLAYIQEIEKEKSDTTKSKKKETFKQLVLRNLSTNKEVAFPHVDKYQFSDNGAYLVYSIKNDAKKKKSEDEENESDNVENIEVAEKSPEGVYVVDTKSFKQTTITDKKGLYSRLQFNDDSDLLAFVATHDEEKEEVKNYSIYLYNLKSNQLQTIENDIDGMPEDWVVSENYSPRFSKNNQNLFLGIAPKKEFKDSTFIEEDHAVLDIWHYKDDYLQTQQLARLKRNLNRSYLSVVSLDNSSKLIPLEDEKINHVRLVNEGDADFVFAMSDYGYRVEKQWDISGNDTYYLVDIKSGEQKEILKNLSGRAYMSPEGKNVVFFDAVSENWYVYDIKSEEIKHLNKGLDVSFADEQNDRPMLSSPYPIVGWTEGDNEVLINDRYDIWQFDLKGNKTPKNITKSYGRENKTRFSLLKLDKEARHLNTEKKAILAAFNEENKESGYYELDLRRNKGPKKLLMEPMSGHRSLVKAKDKDMYLFVHQSYVIPPTLASSKNLKSYKNLHQTNPQQKEYNWSTIELINYTAQNGKPAVGMLIKPEDFDENKKYPLISYFYERRSDNLHSYEPPAPTRSRLNITFFASNGYLVFVPDIEYTTGYPGRSAEEYIDAGIDYLIETYDFVDKDRIGIQGQSWGGYQVAHLITRSNRYAAAWSGAPVVNMTSAYGGIRWTSGLNRQFQYEQTQSRIGKNLWDALDLYLENSPLFYMENVSTPVVIMHNDKDGSVPWEQGIEMFTALRRLGKPSWLLNYNGDEHNLIKRQNQKDIQRRQLQFFDHYLKDAPAPEWMVRGIPATEKGKTWGFELTDEKP